MKILFSLTYYHPYVSGLTICVKRLAESLADRQHTVSVRCMQHDPRLPKKEQISGVSVDRSPVLFRLSKGFISFSWFVSLYRDILHADSVVINLPQPEGIVVAFLARLLKRRVVVIYHCELVLPPSLVNHMIQSVADLLHAGVLLCAHDVVCYTKDYATHTRILRFFLKKCKYIYPPILYPKIDKRIQKDINSLLPKKDHIYVGIAARISAEKGIEYVLDAIEQMTSRLKTPYPHQDLAILIAGPTDPVGESAYKAMIQQKLSQYKETVFLLGTIPQESMGSFYALLDVLVVSSINATEAFGMVQAEAMLYGVPVVATDLPGVRVPVSVTCMGKIIPPRDSSALAEAVISVVQQKDLYQKQRADIQQIFSASATVDAYEALITSRTNT